MTRVLTLRNAKRLCDNFTQGRTIFADASGEHDRVGAAEDSGHGADFAAQAMGVNIEGEFRARGVGAKNRPACRPKFRKRPAVPIAD